MYDKIENEKRKSMVATLDGYCHEQVQVYLLTEEGDRRETDLEGVWEGDWAKGTQEDRREVWEEDQRHMQLLKRVGKAN